MGRQHAPQPLALANSSHPQAQAVHALNTDGPIDNNSATSLRAITPPNPSPNHSAVAIQGQRSPHPPNIGVASSGETSTLQVIPTPTSSKSPRSPRSPFRSKFNTTKSQTHVQSPSQSQSYLPPGQPSPAQPSPPLRLHYLAGPVADTYEQAHEREDYYYPQPPQPPQPPTSETSSNVGTPAPNVKPSVTTPALREGAGQSQSIAQQPHIHEEEKHSRSASRFFGFNKSSKSSHQSRDQHRDRDPHQHRDRPRDRDPYHQLNTRQADGNVDTMSRGAEPPNMPDRVSSKSSKHSNNSTDPNKAVPPLPSRSDLSLASGSGDYDTPNSKKSKPKPFTLLNRSRSVKDKEGPSPKDTSNQPKIQEPERAHTFAGQQPLRTAPVEKEGHEHRHKMNSTARNQSADRALSRDVAQKETRSDKENRSHPSSFKDNSSSNFFSGLKSSGSRAADMLSKGLFGYKSARSGSTTEREHPIDDEHYQLKVINLPLVEQTRMTRISKKLEESRDKTEFWMPAFPWRAIDYLNYKGSDVEGLYRVPGSGPQIKKWQRRFDEEYDVDLFAQDDLYDINIIGSMLKAWLRELPDELFPKEAQDRIARECVGAEEVPQLLIDELSNLSPYNYYLLFAITCHLSLLLAHSDKNKMDFRNLCICFQPCMKIDVFCFRFLVCDWRECWQGCKNEVKYIEEEYALLQQTPPRGLGGSHSHQNSNGNEDGNSTGSADSGKRDVASSHGERNISSSDSGDPSRQSQEQQSNGKLRKKAVPPSQSNGNVASNRLVPNNLSVSSTETPRRSGDLRPLSPIKPLSPLGF